MHRTKRDKSGNTPHIVIDELKKRIQPPIISIVDETCKAIQKKGIKRVVLLGTKSTMTTGFYQKNGK